MGELLMDKKRLKEIAHVYSGATLKRYQDENGTLRKVIVQKSIKKEEKISNLNEVKFNEKLNNRYLTQKGDILMKTPFPNDTVHVEDEGMVIGDRIAIIRLKKNYNPSFITHLLNNYYIKKQLHKVKSSSITPQVSIQDIKKLELILPPYEKQKKYGELLDSIDEKINVNYQIIKADEEIKEGIINKLNKGDI